MELLDQLEARIQKLGVSKLEQRIARLEVRSWFFFFRLRMLMKKIRFLKGN